MGTKAKKNDSNEQDMDKSAKNEVFSFVNLATKKGPPAHLIVKQTPSKLSHGNNVSSGKGKSN